MFNPLMAKAVRSIKGSGDVCEFGNQRYGVDASPISVKDWYLANGYRSYVALDVNSDKDAEVHDLNYPVFLSRQFDLVTNNGTSEHLFNQAQVFRTAHELCKVGGIILHCLPFHPYINHGFYNYNPILFRDMSLANGYEIVLEWIGERGGNFVGLDLEDYKPRPTPGLMKKVARFGNCLLVFALRKVTDDQFRFPIQGKYLKDIGPQELKERYA